MSNPSQPIDPWIADKIIKLSEAIAALTSLGQASNLRDEELERRIEAIEAALLEQAKAKTEHAKKLAEEARLRTTNITVEVAKAAAGAFFGGMLAVLSGPFVHFIKHLK